MNAPDPPTHLTLAWVDFDTIVAHWDPPATPVDRYVAEGRIESGGWQEIEDQIPATAIGGLVGLDPATPELVTLGVRLHAVRGAAASASTPEATLFRGLRAPSGLVVHSQYEDVALSWTQPSASSLGIRVERWGDGQRATVAVLPPTAVSWVDVSTAAPGVSYTYQLVNLASYKGAEVQSDPAMATADWPTSLAPPTDVQAQVSGGDVRITWVPRSRNGEVQRVERTPATFAAMPEIVGELGPTEMAWLEPAPPAGTWLYRVQVGLSGWTYGWATSDPVTVYVPPDPGPWGLTVESLRVPYGDGTARGDDGAWWFANHWTLGAPWLPRAGAIWTPSGSGWTQFPFPGHPEAEYAIEPGILLGPAGEPHVLWLLNVDPTTVPGRQELHHAWMVGGSWHDEFVAERVFWNDNLRMLAQFGIDGAGALHVVWAGMPAGGGAMQDEYATNAAGSWAVTSLPVTLLDPVFATQFQLAVAPDGNAHVAVSGTSAAIPGPGISHLRRSPGGTWTEELVPAGTLSYMGATRLVARNAEDVDLLYTTQDGGADPCLVRFIARTGAGWGAPETLGACAQAAGNPLPGMSSNAEASRRAALLELPDGLGLATWQAATGWTVQRIGPTANPEVPWLGFDLAGTLHLLVPGLRPGEDGWEERVHLRTSR
ncbi:MAG TPA: hypothetical protein PLL32_01110 [Anaeromyxobacteraceae bacterium]|nr:hypothetical protein [Anaeromyxobacteraceae bacterium]